MDDKFVRQDGGCKTRGQGDKSGSSKMSRASSLPSASAKTSSSLISGSSTVTNKHGEKPTQAEVVKSRILKTEAELQKHCRSLKCGSGTNSSCGDGADDAKAECGGIDGATKEHNPDSPYIDVEALSDGDEKVECEQGRPGKCCLL